MKLLTRPLAKFLVLMGLMVLSASSFAQSCPANSRASVRGQTGAFELTSTGRLDGPGTGIFCATNPGYFNERTGDPYLCPASSMSMLSSDRWICPVPTGWGTTFPANSQQGAIHGLQPIGGGRYGQVFINFNEAPPGYYLTGGVMTPCPVGTYAPNGHSTSCSPARLGFFVSSTAQSSDTICPRNTTTTQRGQISCTPANETLDVNVARSRPTSQSSTYSNPNNFTSGQAVDGNNNTINHTNAGSSEWWSVNLQGNFALSGIQINNRQDCCQDRLVGATVQVLDSAGNVKWSTPINAVQQMYLLTPPWGTIASYVRILNRPGQHLNMGEVLAWVPAYVYTTTGWGQ